MAHFGSLLKKLREERGLTQGQLAGRSGVSTPTIQRAEAGEACQLRRSTAREVYAALHRTAPLEPTQAGQFLKAAGLSPQLALQQVTGGTEGRQVVAFNAFLESLTDDQERLAATWFLQFLDEVGAASILDTLRGIAAHARVELHPPTVEELREITIAHPPVQRPGHVEQRFEHLTVKPAELKAGVDKAKRRKAQ